MFDQLTIVRSENREKAISSIVEKCQRSKIGLGSLFKRESFDILWSHLGDAAVQTFIFPTKDARQRLNERYQMLSSENIQLDKIYDTMWKPACMLFAKDSSSGRKGTITIEGLLLGFQRK